jgi:hypothetical protein
MQYFLHVDGVAFSRMPQWNGPIPFVPRQQRPDGAAAGAEAPSSPAVTRGTLEEFLS